jgi:2-dehydro-3-deoxyphosphogalactonate aldolase
MKSDRKGFTCDPPLAAILRGLPPEDARGVGAALAEAGFRVIEVPLNRSGALEAIATLAGALSGDILVGGGTVLTRHDVDAVARAGGRLVVSPNTDALVIRHAVQAGLWCIAGVATPSEAFHALDAGAHVLKVFPAEMVRPEGLKALLSVLPAGTQAWPVGGIDPTTMPAWVAAGATGFGLGSSLYRPGMDAKAVQREAQASVAAWRASVRR